MTQKGFANIVVVIIAVLVLAAAGGYFAFKQDFFAGSTDKVSKPIIDLKASPLAVEKNGIFLLTWSTQNAVSCEASSPTAPDLPFKMNWSGPIELSGSRTYNGAPHDLLFELTCKNSAGDSVFATASIVVESEKASNEIANWKTFRDENNGYEFKYPADIFEVVTANTIRHMLKNFHRYSEKDGSDLGLANDITLSFTKGVSECKTIEPLLKEIAMPFEFQNIKGLKYETGAEGEGAIYYCIKSDENKTIFLIKRLFLHETYSANLPKQPDFISGQEQEKITSRILSTFQFIQ